MSGDTRPEQTLPRRTAPWAWRRAETRLSVLTGAWRVLGTQEVTYGRPEQVCEGRALPQAPAKAHPGGQQHQRHGGPGPSPAACAAVGPGRQAV